MNILYIGYWNIKDPLTVATVFPNLKVLNEFTWVDRIVFTNVEREREEDSPFSDSKIIYRPYLSIKRKNVLVEKFKDFIEAPRFFIKLIRDFKIDIIIARGSPAGGLAYLVWRSTKTKFFVESFEPHAQYMVAANVWSPYDPRTLVQEYLESKQKQNATGLMPVAENYSVALQKLGVDKAKIKTVPCFVDTNKFSFSITDRQRVRNKLGIGDNSIVGIYVGRFGGLYLEKEVFALYKTAFDFYGDNFHLILLVPEVQHKWVLQQINENTIPRKRVHLMAVHHKEVPMFLSASDFGFATYKFAPAMAYLSPVKVGEYWANGIPVLLTNGVGDETRLIQSNPFAGVLFDKNEIHKDGNHLFGKLKAKISRQWDDMNAIQQMALKYRTPNFVVEAYKHFLKEN
jgi:glycosyltransferase involved in cell wall biosynthesis